MLKGGFGVRKRIIDTNWLLQRAMRLLPWILDAGLDLAVSMILDVGLDLAVPMGIPG